jgi:anti-anti-sigma regulatory factor
MRARLEFDATHELLLLRAEGQFTEQSVRSNQASVRKYATATGAQAVIFDLSGVAEFVLSTNFIKSLAKEEPSVSASHPLVIVAPSAHGFGLSRMFQSLGDQTRPLLQVVRTMDEALSVLGIPSPHFEPLD